MHMFWAPARKEALKLADETFASERQGKTLANVGRTSYLFSL